jgi:hypothetical protein
MSFLVYFFVLLVAAGSVVFGLDWTQAPLNPPPYAAPAQIATVTPAPVPHATTVAKTKTVTNTPRSSAAPAVAQVTPAAAPAHDVAVHDVAGQAQARATEASVDRTASVSVAAHCNVDACSAAYHSFRASDCTYQPFGSERRLCTKSTGAGRVAAATHSRSVRRIEPRADRRVIERRLTDRRDYEDDRGGGWVSDLFGGDSYDDDR